MEDFYKLSFDRLRSLLKECDELEAQRQEIVSKHNAKEKVALNLQSYLSAELKLHNDPKLLEEFERVVQRKVDFEQTTDKRAEDGREDFSLTPSNSKNVGFNKTHFVMKLMKDHNEEGLPPIKVYELTQDSDKKSEFKLMYVHNVLGKLKKRGLVEKRDEKYFLTDSGLKFVEEIK